MPKYKVSTKTTDSDYESDGGRKYKPHAQLGKGESDLAREFLDETASASIAVLNPVQNDHEQKKAKKKEAFFRAIYPESPVILFPIGHQDYRLILPKLPGREYRKLDTSIYDEFDCLKLFISAAAELQRVHNLGYVIVDLKADNILYQVEGNRSYVIDGGCAEKIGKPLESDTFLICRADYNQNINKYRQIAPECWRFSNESFPIVDASMDIYSLGHLMSSILPNRRGFFVNNIIAQCKSEDPGKRPVLSKLLKDLLTHANKFTANQLGNILLDLVYNHQYDLAKLLLKNRPDATRDWCYSKHKNYAIHLAVLEDKPDFDLIKLLSQNNNYLNRENKDKETALHIAVRKKHYEIVDHFLQGYADKFTAGQMGGILLGLNLQNLNTEQKENIISPASIPQVNSSFFAEPNYSKSSAVHKEKTQSIEPKTKNVEAEEVVKQYGCLL